MAQMKIDVRGQVNNTDLPVSKGIWSLFEAVVNSIQAMDDLDVGEGLINVYAKREDQWPDSTEKCEQMGMYGQKELMPFESFFITDNGRGFTSDNYDSFNTAHSTLKIAKGCKGIGRFLWLKAFDEVSIDSNFEESGKWFRRVFKFNENGISPDDDDNISESANKERKTTIALKGFKKLYQKNGYVPKKLEGLASKIVEHCLTYFIVGKCPRIVVRDDFDTISLNDYYNTHIKDTLTQDRFEVSEREFILYHLHLEKDASAHILHLCAHNREVKSVNLSGSIPNLQKKIRDEAGAEFFYAGYLVGEYLDGIVNSSRTILNFPTGEHSELQEGLSERDITDAATPYVTAYLQIFIDGIDKRKKDQLQKFVAYKQPKYRFMLSMRPETVDAIKADLPDSDLEMALHSELLKWEDETFKKGEVIKREVAKKGAINATVMPLFEQYYKGLNELNKVSLAEYVTRRKVILDLLQDALQLDENGKYKNEDMLHSIICPMRVTSDDISFEEMNLWIIDEKLAYHRYLSSDKITKELPIIDSTSQTRMDIAVFNMYDEAFSFAAGDRHYNSITIVEFKKPNRNDYTIEENPIDQVLDYVEILRSPKAKSSKGEALGDLSHVAFYCYVIADLTDKLEKTARRHQLEKTPDGMGFFGYDKDVRAYIEVISYRKLLDDASDRNQVLFDKLFKPQPTDLIHRLP